MPELVDASVPAATRPVGEVAADVLAGFGTLVAEGADERRVDDVASTRSTEPERSRRVRSVAAEVGVDVLEVAVAAGAAEAVGAATKEASVRVVDRAVARTAATWRDEGMG